MLRKQVRFVCGIIFYIVVLLSLVPACRKEAPPAPPPPRVTVEQPVSRPVTYYVESTGNTEAVNTVQLRARVEGYLEQVFFQDGAQVKKGQILFLIQQNTFEARARQADAQVLAQQASLSHASQEFARFSELLKRNAATRTDVDQWRYQRDAAQAGLEAAEAARDLAMLDLTYTRVNAPFDGRIDRRLVDEGNLVGAGGSTVLAEIRQVDPLYVYFTINERDVPLLLKQTGLGAGYPGQDRWPVFMGIAGEPDYPHAGELDFAAVSLNPTTGTLLMRGVFRNPGGEVLPGLFARIRLPASRERQKLLVPQKALGFDLQGPYVLVVGGTKVERRGVVVGQQVGDLRVIEQGLAGEEWVVVEGVLKAVPGRDVTAEKPGAQPAGTPAEPEKKAGQ